MSNRNGFVVLISKQIVLQFNESFLTTSHLLMSDVLVIIKKYIYFSFCSRENFTTIVELPEGRHEYKFYVDGIWVHDPGEVRDRYKEKDHINVLFILIFCLCCVGVPRQWAWDTEQHCQCLRKGL